MSPEDDGGRGWHLGIDLGATNIKWCVVESAGDGWSVVDRGQVETRGSEGAHAVVTRIARLAAERITRWPETSTIGIGVPGLYDPRTGTTRFLPNLPGAWRGQPVAGPVAESVGVPVSLVNDARAFGFAELRLGAARGAPCMAGFVLGTGVGGVVAVGGRVHEGHDGTAGELGHQTINPDGPWCTCGNRGCLEAYARADQVAAACGAASPEAAVEAARGGDARARDGLAQVGRYLGIGVANVVTILSPDRVVIGGGVAAAGDLLLDPVRAELRRRVNTTELEEVEIVPAALGVWAGAIGAAVHGAEAAAEGRATRPSPGPAPVVRTTAAAPT